MMMGLIAQLGTAQCTFLFQMHDGIHQVYWIGYITHLTFKQLYLVHYLEKRECFWMDVMAPLINWELNKIVLVE